MQWIDEELKRRGLARARLAEAIPGLTETKISLIMSGNRKLTADEADAIRHFFGYRLPDDPGGDQQQILYDQISRLGDHQIRAVALYLEALTGDDQSRREA